jgi:hypothetical protein
MTRIWGIVRDRDGGVRRRDEVSDGGRVVKATVLVLLKERLWSLVVESAFLFGGSMDKGFERRKGHWVVIAQKRRNIKATRGHGSRIGTRKEGRQKVQTAAD